MNYSQCQHLCFDFLKVQIVYTASQSDPVEQTCDADCNSLNQVDKRQVQRYILKFQIVYTDCQSDVGKEASDADRNGTNLVDKKRVQRQIWFL